MSSVERLDFLARSVAALVAWVTRHPRAVLVVALVLTLASIHVAYTRLEYHTQRNDLISADKPCQQRWQQYLDAFGDDDDMVVVVEGTNRDQMTAALDAVAARLKERPDLFDRVFHRVDLRRLRDRGLLYLPLDQLEAIRASLDRMEPLLGPTGPLAWRMLSVQSLLGSAEGALNARAAGRELSPADRDLLAQLPAVASSAADTLGDPTAYRNPWSLGSANPEGEERRRRSINRSTSSRRTVRSRCSPAGHERPRGRSLPRRRRTMRCAPSSPRSNRASRASSSD